MPRAAKLAAVLGLAVAGLAACQKPVPDITVLGGGDVVQVRPSTYCFDSDSCRTQKLDIPTITAKPDERVMVDVPNEVAKHGWTVAAIGLADLKQLKSAQISDHSYRIDSGLAGGDPFIVEVASADGASKWSFLLKVSSAA